MAKKRTKKQRPNPQRRTEIPYGNLRTSCFKLRALAHLLGRQGDDGTTELDEPDIWYGLGLIMTEIHDEIMSVARQIEDEQIKVAQKDEAT